MTLRLPMEVESQTAQFPQQLDGTQRRGLSLTLSHQHNQEWGIHLSSAWIQSPYRPKPANPLYLSSLDLDSSDLPKGHKSKLLV